MESQKQKMNGWIAAVSAFAALLLLISACCAVDPFVPQMQPKIDNHSVSPPDSKTWDQPFKYTVNYTFPYVVDLTLEVYDLSVGDWCPVESGNSTEIENEKWQIVWENVTICSGTCSGTSRYRFKYNGSVLKYLDGTEIIYKGPKILKKPSNGGNGGGYYEPWISYENATVDPNWAVIGVRERKTFNYSVEVDKDDPLILEVYNLSSTVWVEKGKGEKSKLEREKGKWKHEWTVTLTLDCNWVGRGKYRFYPENQGKYASQVYYGPDYKLPEGSTNIWKEDISASNTPLAVPTITANVEPKEGMWFKKFTYTANVKHPNKAKMMVVLFVYKPESDDWVPVAKGRRYNYIINTPDYKGHNKATVMWTVDRGNVFDEDDAGKWSRFYIWYWDGWNEIDCEKSEREGYDEGPELLTNSEPRIIKDPELNFLNGSTSTVFEYSFEVEDDVNDTVYGLLTVIDPLNNSYILNKVEKTRKVENKTDGRGVASLRFIVDPDSDIFTEEKLKQYEKETGKDAFTSQYSLECRDECREMMGIGEKFKTDKFTGPTVIAVDVKPTKTEVSPKEVTYADEFEITTEFYSSKENTISLDLTVYDPSNNNEICNASGYLKITSGNPKGNYSWKIKPVGLAYAGKTLNYSITWEDSFNTIKNISGSDLHIKRIVPLSSFDAPLIPVISMVAVPLCVIGLSLLSVLSGVSVISLLKGSLGGGRKKRKKEEKE